MGTFLVVAGRVRFPSAAALAKWKASRVDGASVGEWCEPLEGPAGAPFDGLTVEEVFAQATAPDFAAGRVATRTDALEVSLAAGLEEGDGITVWAPLLVAAMRRSSSVKAKGELVVGHGDEEHRTRVSISAKGSSMDPIDDGDGLLAAHDAIVPAVELYNGARTELDAPVEAAPAPQKPAAKKKEKPAAKKARPVKRPLGWKRVTSGTTAALRALAMRPGGIVWAAGDHGTVVTGPVEGPWAPVATGVESTFRDLYLDGERRIWVAGREVLRSDDDGKTFVRVTPEGAGSANTAIWADGDRVLCGDDAGFLRLSTDAGVSWSIVSKRPGPAVFTRIREAGGALWASGTSGTLLVSSDRGASFEALPAAPTAYVDVVFLGERRVVVAFNGITAGDPPVDIAPKHDRDVDFGRASVSGSVLWVCHLGVIRTEDGGATWEQTYPRDSDFPFAMIALGPRSVLMVGPRGSAWLGA